MKSNFYRFTQDAAGKVDTLYILGNITDDVWDASDAAPEAFRRQLDMAGETLDIYIDSYGGSVPAGWTMYNLLREAAQKRGVQITTHGMGFVASSALYPFMAGAVRIAHTPSAYFFHRVSGIAAGYASDIRKAADDIDKMTDIGISAFTDHTALTRDDVQALMDAETWLSPQEAFDKGIATAILTEAPSAGASQSAKNIIFQRLFHSQLSAVPPAPDGADAVPDAVPAPDIVSPPEPLTTLQRLRKIYH